MRFPGAPRPARTRCRDAKDGCALSRRAGAGGRSKRWFSQVWTVIWRGKATSPEAGRSWTTSIVPVRAITNTRDENKAIKERLQVPEEWADSPLSVGQEGPSMATLDGKSTAKSHYGYKNTGMWNRQAQAWCGARHVSDACISHDSQGRWITC